MAVCAGSRRSRAFETRSPLRDLDRRRTRRARGTRKCSPNRSSRSMASDNPLFGIDEILVLSICNLYGSIGLTNFGYVDKIEARHHRPARQARQGTTGHCHTFMDDIIGAVAARGRKLRRPQLRDLNHVRPGGGFLFPGQIRTALVIYCNHSTPSRGDQP
ncbi:MAG: hypothetical protein MZU97_10435 [Bacillus subtilis]|nr:hypothetical protein [Bacillus subtilis]